MKLDKVYNFFFHPFSEKHAPEVKAFSIITIIALSLLTGGGFLIAFGLIQLRDRKVTVQNSKNHKMTPLVKKTIQQASSHSEKADQVSSTKLSPESKKKIEKIKAKNEDQVKLFENWAENKAWKTFRPEISHYDWWAFPVDRPSAGYGTEYMVNLEEISALKADDEFMRNYRIGVDLVVKSWGWDLKTNAPVPSHERTSFQQWTGYGVRLGKMASSLKLFGEKDLYKSLQHFFDEVCLPQIEKYPLEEWVYLSLGKEI